MNFTTYSEISIIAKFLEILVDIGRNHKAFHQQDGDRDIHHQKEYMEKFLFITDYISNHFSENLTHGGGCQSGRIQQISLCPPF